MADRMIEIAGIGASVADALYTVPEYPGEDTKMCARAFKMAGGGPAATGLVAAARMGCSTAYLGTVGQDLYGRFLRADFERYGVDLRGAREGEASCRSFTSCIWINTGNGSRTCVFDRGTLPPYRLTGEAREILKNVKLLLVDGNELDAAVEAADLVHESGGLILYDAGGLYPHVDRLLARADILIPSAEFAMGYTQKNTAKEAASALYRMFTPKAVVVTDGKNGGVRCEGAGEPEPYRSFPVKTVDSNGAGDVFHGAFAAGVAKGLSFESCCSFASMAAALKCTGFGARESIPGLCDVQRALEREGVSLI